MDQLRINVPSCFISYCHDDADHDSLQAFETLLSETASLDLRIFRDKSNIKVGERISEHENLIYSVDAVILIMTPKLKEKILNRIGGISREYSKAYNRYLLSNQFIREHSTLDTLGDRGGDPFALIPILFSGDHEKSVPPDLLDVYYDNFISFRTAKDREGRLILPDDAKRKYSLALKKIVDTIRAVALERSAGFNERYRSNLRTLLLDTKAQSVGRRLSPRDRDHIFVKTKAYEGVVDQKSLILIGRKGSGKSTITDYLHRRSSATYKPKIQVDVDKFVFEYIFNIVLDPQLSSELTTILPHKRFFETAWRAFFYVACIQVLLGEQVQSELDAEQKKYAPTLQRFFRNLVPEDYPEEPADSVPHWPLFVWSLNKLATTLDAAINKSRTAKESFYSDLALRATDDRLLEGVLTKPILNAFRGIISHCKKKFLFALDGFDTNFDQFRINTLTGHFIEEIKAARTKMEIDWLRGMLHAAMRVKSGEDGEKFGNMIEFCITVPTDRFLKIRAIERDDYIYRWKHSDILWTGIELALLCRKRLEVMTEFRTDKGLDPMSRFHEVLREKYPGIPTTLAFMFNGKPVRIDLFFYFLRHTFWRPRDVLFYLAKIISTYDSMRGSRKSLSVETVKRMVASTTYDVVRSEFINEFKSMCPNIEMVLRLFDRAKISLSFDELAQKIGDTEFRYAYQIEGVKDLWEKVNLLYEIGFIGFRVQDREGNTQAHNVEVFYFSDGDKVFKSFSQDDKRRLRYIIHPVFVEYLRLDTRGESFVLNYTLEYVRDNDLLPPWS